MRIVVLCHAVPDFANLSISKSQDRVFEKGKRLLFAPDAVALEVALQGRQAGDEVVALAWGEEANREILKKLLAMGADRAVWTAGDPAAAAMVLGAEVVFGSTVSPLGVNVLPSRVGSELGLPEDRARLVAPDAASPRIPNALAIMKAAKKPVETVETPAREVFVRRWATLLAAEEA
jgi:electron transfer flavoprotein alpha/beta subunit